MNYEMMPIVGLMLQSEDLKKQSERIIQEVRVSNDVKKLTDEFIKQVTSSDTFKTTLKFQEEQRQTLQEIKNSVDSLHQKIDSIINSKNYISTGSGVYSSEKDDKKTGRK
jgi:hypothetical protein